MTPEQRRLARSARFKGQVNQKGKKTGKQPGGGGNQAKVLFNFFILILIFISNLI